MILYLYSFLTLILSFLILPVVFLIRILQKKDVSSWKIKAGCFEIPKEFNKNKKTILIHGVSVGEIVSLEKLIRKIKKTFPECNLVITTGTKTGQETAIKKMSDVADFITYFPFDITCFVQKFLNKISPDVVLIAETEIWPNFAICCNKRKIPLYIINGRMSDESFKMYKILSPFFRRILPLYTGIYVQSEIDKKRLEKAGANINKLEVMKNLKFDIEKFDAKLDIDKTDFKVLIAGSTHKGEDEIVIEAFKNIKDKNIKLLLAPRHLTRTDDVIKLLENNNLKYNLYSSNNGFKDADVLLLDVMGELAKLYSISDVAFIGGSFNKTGGHNPLEAIIFNKPVISGPSVKNFRDIYSILSESKAAFVVKTKEEFFSILNKMFDEEKFYTEIVKNTENIFNNQQGALDFVIKKLSEVI